MFLRLSGLNRCVCRFYRQMPILSKAHHERWHRKLTDEQIDQEAAKGEDASMIPLHTVRIASFLGESSHPGKRFKWNYNRHTQNRYGYSHSTPVPQLTSGVVYPIRHLAGRRFWTVLRTASDT
jgi:hypothetical protein